MSDMIGIIAAGAYVPRLRLDRAAVASAHAWFSPGLNGLGRGVRAMANWDEDPITMAVEAARDCMGREARDRISRLVLASTSLPFSDRQNAGVVKEALDLPDAVGAMDVTGSQRAGTSALLNALYAAGGGGGDVLCIGSEKRKTRPGSEAEMTSGDAAGAVLVGRGDVAAEFIGGHSLSADFIDHFRAEGQEMDYTWEARWVRDEGYAKIAPLAIKTALDKAGLTAAEIGHFVMAAPMKGVNELVAKAVGIPADRVRDPLTAELGDAGAAQPLILLAHALEVVQAGDILLVVGFGQGCDVLLFRATARAADAVRGLGASGWLARGKTEANYVKYLFLNGHLGLERGMRAEFDQKTALTALYRNRRSVLALVGGKCAKTGTVQFPKSDISVAQNDRAIGTQVDYPLAERRAQIVTYTADSLTYSPDPPVYYGAIEFEEGGRITVEFADVEPQDVTVGAVMRMMFRIKSVDELRGFTRYFWKAVPDFRTQPSATLAAE